MGVHAIIRPNVPGEEGDYQVIALSPILKRHGTLVGDAMSDSDTGTMYSCTQVFTQHLRATQKGRISIYHSALRPPLLHLPLSHPLPLA